MRAGARRGGRRRVRAGGQGHSRRDGTRFRAERRRPSLASRMSPTGTKPPSRATPDARPHGRPPVDTVSYDPCPTRLPHPGRIVRPGAGSGRGEGRQS
jgi:hypothetical protein